MHTSEELKSCLYYIETYLERIANNDSCRPKFIEVETIDGNTMMINTDAIVSIIRSENGNTVVNVNNDRHPVPFTMPLIVITPYEELREKLLIK